MYGLTRFDNRNSLLDPFNVMDEVLRQLNPVTSRLVDGDVFGANSQTLDDKYVFEFAVPGFKKEDLNVTVKDSILTVSASAKSQTEDERKTYTVREFGEKSLRRSFRLPSDAVVKDLSAECVDGILTVFVPREEDQGALTIEVK